MCYVIYSRRDAKMVVVPVSLPADTYDYDHLYEMHRSPLFIFQTFFCITVCYSG